MQKLKIKLDSGPSLFLHPSRAEPSAPQAIVPGTSFVFRLEAWNIYSTAVEGQEFRWPERAVAPSRHPRWYFWCPSDLLVFGPRAVLACRQHLLAAAHFLVLHDAQFFCNADSGNQFSEHNPLYWRQQCSMLLFQNRPATWSNSLLVNVACKAFFSSLKCDEVRLLVTSLLANVL
jgi:hypothetical protein